MNDHTVDPMAALEDADKSTPQPKNGRSTKPKAPPTKRVPTPASPDQQSAGQGPGELITPASASELSSLGALIAANLPQWSAEDYEPLVTGTGSEKLASSAVAPLVAAARGYHTVDSSNFTDVMKIADIRGNSKQFKVLQSEMVADGGDGLVMPWYSVAGVHQALRANAEPTPKCIQMRPHTPVSSSRKDDIDKKTGLQRTMKYVLPGGAVTPMDVHPSVPTSWIDSTPVVMFTEGLLKGDAALSAWLRHMGATDEELGDTEDGARQRLTALMERVAAEREGDASADFRPLLVITLVGVYNTQQNPMDWREIQLKGREGWIAYDADVAKNPGVWTAAYRLWDFLETRCKMSSVRVLNPVAIASEDAALEKMGVDDFLAQRGEWPQLITYLQDELPPSPAKPDEVEGAWRVTADGRGTEECVATQDGSGVKTGVAWVPQVPLGGRILSSEVRRRTTAQELASGRFGVGVDREDYEEVRARVQVSWEDRHGQEFDVVVDGPERFLNYTPEQWDRHGADIPTELLYHPSWPPVGKEGSRWMSAIKACRDNEITKSTRWMQMGWVPVEGHDPVFLAGERFVGDADMDPNLVVPGVNEEVLEAAAHYGLHEEALALDWDDPDHKRVIREDLSAVLTAYVADAPWTDPGVAAVVVCAALRPCIPIRPRTTVFLAGGKGSGKSWTAERMMSFWERFDTGHRAHWIDGTLPGSAKDTIAFVENAVSKTPVWVVDDLAPSSSARQSESENAKLEDLTRNIFNNASKGRMNADMTTRRSNAPMAQLIITAENDLQVPSVRERLVPVRFQSGASLAANRDVTDAAVEMHISGVPARVTVHLLRLIRKFAAEHPGGWSGWMAEQRHAMNALQAQIIEEIEDHYKDDPSQQSRAGALRRAGMLAADLAVVLSLLRLLGLYSGLDKDLMALLAPGGIQKDLIKLVRSAHAENAEANPGWSVVESLRDLMRSGRAHVLAPDALNEPPVRTGNSDYDLRANSLLGWTKRGPDGDWQPQGLKIGEVIRRSRTGDDVVVFYEQTAFNEAARLFPSRIPPGTRSYQVWCGVWDEGLAPHGLIRQKDGSKMRASHQFLLPDPDNHGRRASLRGVPVRLPVMLGEESGLDGAEDATSTAGDFAAAEPAEAGDPAQR